MNGVQLLLVEDNEGDIFVTLDAFESSMVINNIIVKTDGDQAISYFKKIASTEDLPDFVLLDINLPKISGHEVLKYLKQHQEYKAIPVIMFTSSSSEDDITKAYQNGVNSFITKPIEYSDYVGVLKRIEEFWLKISGISY